MRPLGFVSMSAQPCSTVVAFKAGLRLAMFFSPFLEAMRVGQPCH